MGAVGTVTYVDGPTVYAFGHELDGAGRRSLLLQDAYVYYVVNNPDPTTAPSYKLASPGHTEGILSSDTPSAVIGEVGAPPPTVPVDVTAHDLDTGQSLSLDTQVADETDIGLPLGNSLVDTIAPLEVAQAATQIYDGPPATESGNMCLRIYLRESRQPLGFCNRYVGTGNRRRRGRDAARARHAPPSADVTTAFADLEQVDFAALHVTHVVADLVASRGLAMASILSAHAPLGSGRAETVRVRLARSDLPRTAPDGVVPATDSAGRERPARRDDPRPRRAGAGDGERPLLAARHLPVAGRRAVGVAGSGSSRRRSPRSRRCAPRSRRSRPTTGCTRTQLGHAKRRVFRDPSLLITGRTTLLVRGGEALEAVLDRERRRLLRRRLGRGWSGARLPSPSTPRASCSSPDSYISVTMSQPPTNSPSMNSCGIVGQFETVESSWRIRGSGRMLTAANGLPTDCRIADRASRESAHRLVRSALHEQDHGVLGDRALDRLADLGGPSSLMRCSPFPRPWTRLD